MVALLSTLTLSLSQTGEEEIIHEKGRCLWNAQCTDKICQRTNDNQFYNIFNNTWAYNVSEKSDKDWYDLIKDTCPMYIDEATETAHVCCSQVQIQTLKTNVKQAQPLINRCPACLSNFIQHYCVVTCDPNASVFMNGTIGNSTVDSSVQIVEKVEVFLTDDYADNLYDSCANVQFSGGGAKVMNLLCGSTDCNPLKFLDFQGNPALNGESPFRITYNLSNETTPYPDGIEHLNDTGIYEFYSCSDNVPGKGTCSCSDCPVTCPAPPSFPTKHLPFKKIALIVGAAGCCISAVIFIAALVVSVYLWYSRRNSGYKRIASEPRPPRPRAQYGATATKNTDRESSTTSSLNSDHDEGDADEDDRDADDAPELSAVGKCCQIGNHVERVIRLVFYHWGRFVAKFWYIVLIVSVVICGVLSFGLFFFTVTTDPVQLWSAPTSRARLEKNYYDENFHPFYRTEQILVKAKPFVQGFNITPEGTEGVVWTFSSAFNKDVLLEVGLRV
jgi:Niemann-Pick C1 protein